MACPGGCGGSATKSKHVEGRGKSLAPITGIPDDYPLVVVRYEGAEAKHTVIGLASRTKYGRKQRGDIFQVLREDVLAYPETFTILTEPTKEKEVLPSLPKDLRPAPVSLRPSIAPRPPVDEDGDVTLDGMIADGPVGTKTVNSFVPGVQTVAKKKKRTARKVAKK